jgi:hypothetical protein
MHKITHNIIFAIQGISFLEGFTVSCNLHLPVEKGSLYYKTRTLVVYKTRLPSFQSERLKTNFMSVLCVMRRTL